MPAEQPSDQVITHVGPSPRRLTITREEAMNRTTDHSRARKACGVSWIAARSRRASG